jgi:hypothetical protein
MQFKQAILGTVNFAEIEIVFVTFRKPVLSVCLQVKKQTEEIPKQWES